MDVRCDRAPSGSRRRGRSLARAVGGVMAVGLVVLGGCVPGVGGSSEKERPVVALVTPKEKDKIGWENPESMLNSDLQRLAMENRQQIYSIVKPYVERSLGREVEMTGISAPYPYQAVNVKYRTVDEPIMAGYEFVGLKDDGTLASEAQIDPDTHTVVDYETVSGLYLMAYRDRVAAMREHVVAAHPHFRELPDGYLRTWRMADPMLKISFHGTGPEKFPAVEAGTAAIYRAFQEQPDRTDDEWRALFEAHDPGFGLNIEVNVMLRDSGVDLTEEMARDLAEDVRAHPTFAGGVAWLVNAYSGQLMSDDIYFHESWSFNADPDMAIFPKWSIDQWVDGFTRQSFIDGDPR